MRISNLVIRLKNYKIVGMLTTINALMSGFKKKKDALFAIKM
jgi:hypothetical protein